jgi:hypothetical protein
VLRLTLVAVTAIEDVDIVSASPISDEGVPVRLRDTRLAIMFSRPGRGSARQ